MFHLSGVGDSIKVRITFSDYGKIRGTNDQKNKYRVEKNIIKDK